MKVQIWTDFGCPYCYMAKTRFDQALQSFPHRGEVEVELMSFELDPEFPKNTSLDVYDAIALKSNISRAKAIAECELLTRQAAEVGLEYRYDRLIPVNTFDAHRLCQYAKTIGKSAEFGALLMRSHFTDGKNLGDEETLVSLGASIGLNPEMALSILQSDAFADQVRADELAGDEIGIEVLPFFVFDDKYAVAGGHPKETYGKVLQKVWNEREIK